MKDLLSIGQVAARLGVKAHNLRRVFTRGFLPEPPRIGTYRLFNEADLPLIKEGLQRAGFLPPPQHGDAA